MNNPNPFLSPGSFLEQKNKARTRLKIVVFFSISLSVVVLMALLIQGCRKPNDQGDNGTTDTNATPEMANNPAPDTNAAPAPAPTPAPDTNVAPPPAPVPPPQVMTPVPAPAPAGEDYTVIKGDTYSTIARKNGTSVRALEQANPGVDPKRLKIGQKLHLPAASSATPGNAAEAGAADNAGGEQTYKVKSGDTLTSIAKRFHVSIKSLQSANNLHTTSIKVGQTLKIPASASAPAPAPAPAPVPPPVDNTPAPTAPPTGGPAPLPGVPPPAH